MNKRVLNDIVSRRYRYFSLSGILLVPMEPVCEKERRDTLSPNALKAVAAQTFVPSQVILSITKWHLVKMPLDTPEVGLS